MTETQLVKVKRALISVSDKTGITEFARQLSTFGVEILSTGGTFRLLRENKIEVTEISDYTEFPEMMDGRVKTLHPKVHGGILGRRQVDAKVMKTHQISEIDMVVVNLYPFENTVSNPDCDLATAIENIDIGGPTMVRAAAKNYQDVVVVVNTIDYDAIINELQANSGALSYDKRFDFAVKAFEHTAAYDSAIANYLGKKVHGDDSRFGRTLNLQYRKKQSLRYGENPHQNAAFYVENQLTEANISSARQLQGKELSFNNIADTDAALETAKQFATPCCVIVKHANPCGVAQSDDQLDAYKKAFATDPESAFGGIIAFNTALDGKTAHQIVENQFVEVIIAPKVHQDALAAVATKQNIRLLECKSWNDADSPAMDCKRVSGGLLVQDRDKGMITTDELKLVTRKAPSEQQLQDLLFAWKVSKMVKSNAIVYAKDGHTVGVGAGQMSRVNSARIAAIKAEHAGLEVKDSVMASDAFFPFRDGIDNAAAAGIKAVIQPGGSMRDEEVIAAADEHGIAMVFTGMRHFRH